MKLIVLDYETYYDDEYSLSKMTTEAYVRDPRFEAIMLGSAIVKEDGTLEEPGWVDGPNIQEYLDDLDIENSAVLCHHTHFDGLITTHHFRHKPRVWFDTLSMARAIHGTEVGGALGSLLKHYSSRVSVVKGDYVVQAKGKHLADFGGDDLIHYGIYCCDDVEGTYQIFNAMIQDGFPPNELRHIDMLIRMFTEPGLELDSEYLRWYIRDLQAKKNTALISAGVTLDEVMSNDKFAAALIRLGVTPPMKRSPTTGKPTYAFAKTDEDLLELKEHPDFRVQYLVSARLQAKSTINETRAQRMDEMAQRGAACIYYKYAGAEQTMRVSGGDSMNWQNLERVMWNDDETELLRGHLRMAVYAPEGYSIVVLDSANIEARIDDTLAGQDNMVEAYRKYDRGEGPDIYCVTASGLYSKEITKKDKIERMLGKIVKLGCGYGMGHEKFMVTAAQWSGGVLQLAKNEAYRAVEGYRATHPMVVQLWARAESALPEMCAGGDHGYAIDRHGILKVVKGGILLPNGLMLKYPGLKYEKEGGNFGNGGWSYSGRRGQRMSIYGGKLVENIVQALAKIVVMDQILAVDSKYNHIARMTTHDEGGFMVPEEKAQEVLEYGLEQFRTPPLWMPFLPVAGAGAIAVRYGEAK